MSQIEKISFNTTQAKNATIKAQLTPVCVDYATLFPKPVKFVTENNNEMKCTEFEEWRRSVWNEDCEKFAEEFYKLAELSGVELEKFREEFNKEWSSDEDSEATVAEKLSKSI